MALRISQLAQATGVAPDAIRFYERLGIVAPAQRTPAGYRLYAPAGVERVAASCCRSEIGGGADGKE